MDPVGEPVIASIHITPDTLAGGTRAEVTWSATDARRAVLRDAQGQVVAARSGPEAAGGTAVELYPNASGAYTLEVDNGLGETASLQSAVVTVTVPVVLVPDLEGAIILGTPVKLTPSVGSPGTLLYGIFHSDYTEQTSSTGFIDISTTGHQLNCRR